MTADELKAEAHRAYLAWESVASDPMASRAQVENAASKFCELSDRLKGRQPAQTEQVLR